jgi:hypothetical protein
VGNSGGAPAWRRRLPNDTITCWPAMNDVDTPRPARVFLSYSKSDQPAARYIADTLKSSGVHAWLDDWELGPGDSFREHIGSAATSSDYILILLSPASVESKWVRQEIDLVSCPL